MAALLYCPGGQGEPFDEFRGTRLANPGGITLIKHAVEVVEPVTDVYRPGGHAKQKVDPALLYCPAGHLPEHAAVGLPDVLPNVPAGQTEHMDCATASEY